MFNQRGPESGWYNSRQGIPTNTITNNTNVIQPVIIDTKQFGRINHWTYQAFMSTVKAGNDCELPMKFGGDKDVRSISSTSGTLRAEVSYFRANEMSGVVAVPKCDELTDKMSRKKLCEGSNDVGGVNFTVVNSVNIMSLHNVARQVGKQLPAADKPNVIIYTEDSIVQFVANKNHGTLQWREDCVMRQGKTGPTYVYPPNLTAGDQHKLVLISETVDLYYVIRVKTSSAHEVDVPMTGGQYT